MKYAVQIKNEKDTDLWVTIIEVDECKKANRLEQSIVTFMNDNDSGDVFVSRTLAVV